LQSAQYFFLADRESEFHSPLDLADYPVMLTRDGEISLL